jgi:hypothetical protein
VPGLFTSVRVARTLGAGLTILGLAGLVVHDLGLTTTHHLAHLGPGIALLVAGLPRAHGSPRRGLFLATGAFYVAVGVTSVVQPGAVDPTLGITPLENVVHLLGGLALIGIPLLLADEPAQDRA